MKEGLCKRKSIYTVPKDLFSNSCFQDDQKLIPSTNIKYYNHHKFVFLWGDRSLGQGEGFIT